MKFPEHIPVLHFISDSNCELMESWERLHNEIVTENIRSETIRLEGGHYLHFEQKEEIAKKNKEMDYWGKSDLSIVNQMI